jgi:hypothetical protein
MKKPNHSRLVDIKARAELMRGRPRDLATVIDAFDAQQDREWLLERLDEARETLLELQRWAGDAIGGLAIEERELVAGALAKFEVP